MWIFSFLNHLEQSNSKPCFLFFPSRVHQCSSFMIRMMVSRVAMTIQSLMNLRTWDFLTLFWLIETLQLPLEVYLPFFQLISHTSRCRVFSLVFFSFLKSFLYYIHHSKNGTAMSVVYGIIELWKNACVEVSSFQMKTWSSHNQEQSMTIYTKCISMYTISILYLLTVHIFLTFKVILPVMPK